MKGLVPELYYLVYYVLTIVGIVVFASIAHAFAAFQKYRKEGIPFSRTDFFILSFLASFSGTMTGIATFAIISQNIVIVSMMAGLGAFAGMALLDRMTLVMLEVFENVLKSFLKK